MSSFKNVYRVYFHGLDNEHWVDIKYPHGIALLQSLMFDCVRDGRMPCFEGFGADYPGHHLINPVSVRHIEENWR